MNPSATVKRPSKNHFLEQANAAALRASRQFAAENRRLGLPLIVETTKRGSPGRKTKI